MSNPLADVSTQMLKAQLALADMGVTVSMTPAASRPMTAPPPVKLGQDEAKAIRAELARRGVKA